MTSKYGKLIVLSGPDKARVISMNFRAGALVLGRSSSANIILKEHLISRKHLSFEQTPDGVIINVLSSNGVEIGLEKPKKYKKGKTLALESGDVIHLGISTRILFVQAGESADKYVSVAKKLLPDEPMDQKAESAELNEEELPKILPEVLPDDLPHNSRSGLDQTLTSVTAATGDPKLKKSRKLLLFFCVYLTAIIGVAVVVSFNNKDKTKSQKQGPVVLSTSQIEQIICRIDDIRENRSESERLLELGARYFASRHINTGDTFRAARAYADHKASSTTGRFSSAADQENFKIACRELIERIAPLYQRAIAASRQKRYASAIDDFEALLKIAPLQTDPFNSNCQKHLAWNREKLAEYRKRRRNSPFDK